VCHDASQRKHKILNSNVFLYIYQQYTNCDNISKILLSPVLSVILSACAAVGNGEVVPVLKYYTMKMYPLLD